MSEYWMQTFTGRKFDPVCPVVDDITIEDIAHALSLTCRYGGHCNNFYSVAEHSLYVSRAVPEEHALWGLLHDATEAYMADLVRPLKKQLADYQGVERNLMVAICDRFELDFEQPQAVTDIDLNIVVDEKRAVMGPEPEPWGMVEGLPLLGIKIHMLNPRVAEQRFLQEFVKLT